MVRFFDKQRMSLRIQSILYRANEEELLRSLIRLTRAVSIARAKEAIGSVEIAWGDCSPTPVLSSTTLERIRLLSSANDMTFEVTVFNENKGTAAGHNALFESCRSDFVLIMNPEVVMAPDCITELLRPFVLKNTGVVEARQLPIEHPKAYDAKTGETSWASTACCLTPAAVMRAVDGFDASSFFLYCDDVDFSWRVRIAGYKVLMQPSASVFHDKRLTSKGQWQSSAAERYYSAEAALLLAHKYSRPDVVGAIVRDFRAAKAEHFGKALASYEKRLHRNELPTPIDSNHVVGEFVGGEYANHRFTL